MTASQESGVAAPAPTPNKTSQGVKRLFRRAFEPFWVIPAMWCIGALIAGVLVPSLDSTLSQYVPLLFQAGPEGARTFLSSIAGAMISVTGLVFSITIVVLQLASSQFSPRVLRTFLDERVPQFTLGIFTASYVYALTLMRSVAGTPVDGASSVPQIGVTISFLLVLLSVGIFLAFIHHITQAISVDTIIQTVGKETGLLLKRSAKAREESSTLTNGIEEQRGAAHTVVSPTGGYLNYVDAHGLISLAEKHVVHIELLHPLGTYLVENEPMAIVHGGTDHPSVDWGKKISQEMEVGWRRTMEQDISFGLRQLVDIADKALSPGVNDPTTAIQVIDQLHTLLADLAPRVDPSPARTDSQGTTRLTMAKWGFGDVLDLCVDEIAHWGASSIQVPRRLDLMLEQLSATASPKHREALEEKRFQVAQKANSAQSA
ncbi:DUF2254 domain-containing protein [Ornithinimicrobium sp. Arc0846-15]|nr:DUF2254 domain-containing protein [Ornithinimicrobium laminariae]